MSSNSSNLQGALRRLFPYNEFRGTQSAVLDLVMADVSALALMPTGMGKSLCFQFPARWNQDQNNQKLVLVVSPLISLMQDQSVKADQLGIAATFINSSLNSEDRKKRQDQISKGKYSLLFVTPERLRKSEFLTCLESRILSLLCVDEAHCMSQWGHDFRPDYSKIGDFRKLKGNPPVLALTATATPDVQTDICLQLGIGKNNTVDGGLLRPNLAISIEDVHGFDRKMEIILAELSHRTTSGSVPGAVIIYTSLIHTLKNISLVLSKKKIKHLLYHGDLGASERKRNQSEFMKAESSIMIATPAFGLGIDKSNVRQIIHFELPGSIESYFQEIGRAGRDGLAAQTTLLYDQDDVSIQMEFLKWSHPDEEFIRKTYLLIASNNLRLQADGFDFLREQLVFKSRRDFRPEAAVNILERWGCLEKTDDGFGFKPIEPPEAQHFVAEDSVQQLKRQQMKLLEYVRWIQQDEKCRLSLIYQYFTGKDFSDCKICDVCLQKGRL